MGVTRQDSLTDEEIRTTLQVNSLNDTICKYRGGWFNHITRMDLSRFARYMLSHKPIVKRSLGRLRKIWISQILGTAIDENPMYGVEEKDNF